jgi:antitoxin component YwqK of YwqJK toxin-antitoxin module
MKEYRITVSNFGTRWYKLGTNQLHREDGPAFEHPDGTKEWYLNGECHREGGPAAELSDGTKYWYLNGKLHREDGPAIEYSDGDKFWYLNGELHREDGPAVEYPSGTKYWYLNGERLTEQDFLARTNACDGRVVEIDGKKYQLKEVLATKK